MRFVNDRQRKAVFASMNKFSDYIDSRKLYTDVSKLNRQDFVSDFEEVPHLFEDRHHLENLEIDAAMSLLEEEFGRKRHVPTFVRTRGNIQPLFPVLPPASISLGDYAVEEVPLINSSTQSAVVQPVVAQVVEPVIVQPVSVAPVSKPEMSEELSRYKKIYDDLEKMKTG